MKDIRTIEKNETDYTYEILNKINHKLDISKYIKNQKLYEKYREDILISIKKISIS